MTMLDKIFREYGVKAYGESAMNKLSNEEIESARIYAFQVLDARTKRYGKQPKNFTANMFCTKIGRILETKAETL